MNYYIVFGTLLTGVGIGMFIGGLIVRRAAQKDLVIMRKRLDRLEGK